MQQPNWNDLRYLLAIKRGQTLGAAARQLRVDDTTVSRRIDSLQAALGMQLVLRLGDGRLALTQAGDAVAQRAEAMENQFQSIGEIAGADQDQCVGTVRITSVPLLINRLFAGAVGGLLQHQPSLVIELVPDSRDLSLTRREADVAVRLGRPAIGGTSVKARRIGMLEFAVYAAVATTSRDARGLPWITFDEAMSWLVWARRSCRRRWPISTVAYAG
jgi:DNA-binding transcriptional LysR family regulator